MSKYLSVLFLLFISTFTVSAQNIYSALRLNNTYDLRKEVPVKEVTTKITFFNTSGTIEVKKEVSKFNHQNRVILEVRYDEIGKKTDQLEMTYDETGYRNISRKFERWMNGIGYISETSYYEYDSSDFLVKVINKNQLGKITSITTIINDAKGYPIELKLVTDNYSDFGKEIAEYDFEANAVVISSLASNGNVLSTHVEKIDAFKYGKGEFVNQNGDPLKSGDYVFTYTYDKNLNWIKKTRYKIINGRQIKNAEFVRNIKYQKK